MARRTFLPPLALPLTLALLVGLAASAVGCGSEDEESGAALTVDAGPDIQPTDVGGGVDVEFSDQCRGTAAQPNLPDNIHAQCEGVTKCTVMEPKTDGSCFCAICGRKGIESACWQQQCPQPGG